MWLVAFLAFDPYKDISDSAALASIYASLLISIFRNRPVAKETPVANNLLSLFLIKGAETHENYLLFTDTDVMNL